MLEWENRSTTYVDWDVTEWGVDSCVGLGWHWHGGMVVPVIPCFLAPNKTGEDTIHGCGTRLENRDNKNRWTQQELSVRASERGIIGELPCKCSHNCLSMHMGVIEESVHIRQKLVADRHRSFASIGNRGPSVGFLADSTKDVVVSVEREEGAQLHPAVAQLHISIIGKSTSVRSEHWDTQKGHGKGLRDGKDHTGPVGPIVTTPMASIGS